MITEEDLRVSYGRRAAEYSAVLGGLEQMDPRDGKRITAWAENLSAGPVLDAGCGPGHWTAHLHSLGVDASGLDLVPEFIGHARARFIEVPFRVGSMRRLEVPDHSLTAILTWYSMIHTAPAALPGMLTEFRRALRPGGQLLIGFFHGPDSTPFPHQITTAYTWSIPAMCERLSEAGFEILDSEHRESSGSREHASITAQTRLPRPA